MKQESREELPFKTLKRILVSNLGGQVSTESVEFIQHLLKNQLKQICKEVIKRQEDENKLREFHGLPPKKRFDVSIFKLISVESINPQYSIIGVDEEGHSNRDTSLSSGKELSQ
jgi:hypothetical protein